MKLLCLRLWFIHLSPFSVYSVISQPGRINLPEVILSRLYRMIKGKRRLLFSVQTTVWQTIILRLTFTLNLSVNLATFFSNFCPSLLMLLLCSLFYYCNLTYSFFFLGPSPINYSFSRVSIPLKISPAMPLSSFPCIALPHWKKNLPVFHEPCRYFNVLNWEQMQLYTYICTRKLLFTMVWSQDSVFCMSYLLKYGYKQSELYRAQYIHVISRVFLKSRYILKQR